MFPIAPTLSNFGRQARSKEVQSMWAGCRRDENVEVDVRHLKNRQDQEKRHWPIASRKLVWWLGHITEGRGNTSALEQSDLLPRLVLDEEAILSYVGSMSSLKTWKPVGWRLDEGDVQIRAKWKKQKNVDPVQDGTNATDATLGNLWGYIGMLSIDGLVVFIVLRMTVLERGYILHGPHKHSSFYCRGELLTTCVENWESLRRGGIIWSDLTPRRRQ